MAWDTAADVIAAACAECGLTSVADPFASTSEEQVQMRNLLNQAGRELVLAYPHWQQFVRTHSIATGGSPVSDGQYALPSDFLYLVNQTGWNDTDQTRIRGPLTLNEYAYAVATDMLSDSLVAFLLRDNEIQIVPAPAPADTTLTFQYMSNAWVHASGDTTTRYNKATTSSQIVMFEPILITKMVAARFKQAKGLDAGTTLEQFQFVFDTVTGTATGARPLSLTPSVDYPYIDPIRNLPATGFGS